MKFRAEIEQGESKNVTGIEIPVEVVEALGGGKRPAVKVTLNGYTYRSMVAVMGGAYMVGVSADVREKAKVKGGDVLDIEMVLDTEKREVEVPADFAKALGANKKAKAFYEGLSYTNRKRFATLVDEAKAPETRTRRIEKFVAQLAEGKV